MRRIHGDGIIHVNKIHSLVEGDLPLYEYVSERPSDVVMELVQKGIINGIRKKRHPGKIVSGFVREPPNFIILSTTIRKLYCSTSATSTILT
ncbi:hypothetical protein LEP1GSC188_3579 [Leptospira weilii serovar Topaz str. LT2116]|uniref:Uncharacterized protein n=1 Tax=Leptospira weilii serovar Topaz str. LT2116 TaxID=1088540 RepID=M3GW79_9LEPT|nr:hypothetical protein LEP1GSC188_3579 [Leptospira weilii serovar Topaz str. LT2116]